MGYPTSVELTNRLDGNIAHRRKDLSDLVLSWRASTKDSPTEVRYRRLVVAMLYAHWEGFVKDASHAYLKHIAGQGLKVGQLNTALRAVAARGHILAVNGAKKTSAHAVLITGLDELQSRPFDKYPTNCIDTESNLSSTVFREIVATLGVRYMVAYELMEKRLDSNLVWERNRVVHGELASPDYDETASLVDEVWKRMNSFKRQIEDSAARLAYLAGP